MSKQARGTNKVFKGSNVYDWPWPCLFASAMTVLIQWAFLHRCRALPETFVHFLIFTDTFKSFSLTFDSFDSWLWNGFLERALRIKPNNILLLFSFLLFYSIMRFKENSLPDLWIIRFKLHLKTDIARIAKRWVRYWFSRAI